MIGSLLVRFVFPPMHSCAYASEEHPMTVDDRELPGGDSKQRLDILLADYQSCREDERVQVATNAVFHDFAEVAFRVF